MISSLRKGFLIIGKFCHWDRSELLGMSRNEFEAYLEEARQLMEELKWQGT